MPLDLISEERDYAKEKYREMLLEAAESVREAKPVSWAEVAADLGYADQAHLTRSLKRFIGQTPAQMVHAVESWRSGAPVSSVRGNSILQIVALRISRLSGVFLVHAFSIG